MDAAPSTNPYRPGDPLAPFAGRQAELARIDQYLKDPLPGGSLAFMGWHWLGKSALLRRFDSIFDDSFLGVYLPMKQIVLPTEDDLLHAIMDGTARALALRDLTLTRIPEPEADTPFLRVWFAETWLPAVLSILRQHRKLVLLVDDAQAWLDAEAGEGWLGGSFNFFADLLQQEPQFKLILTFAGEREDDLPRLSPLVNPAAVQRLALLPLEATRWLLRYPGLYAVVDDSVTAVHRATGGHPQLLQRFAHHIYQYYETHPGTTTIMPDTVRLLQRNVYHASVEELTNLWARSTDVEQLVLLTFSNLRYEDPLKAINAEAIATWLIDSDYVLDRTTIHAALRSLEYRELMALRSGSLELTIGLLQTWLLENTSRAGAVTARTFRLRRSVVIAALAIGLLAVILVISLSNTPQTDSPATTEPRPTVTLANNGDQEPAGAP
jgi:hypothetical protein